MYLTLSLLLYNFFSMASSLLLTVGLLFIRGRASVSTFFLTFVNILLVICRLAILFKRESDWQTFIHCCETCAAHKSDSESSFRSISCDISRGSLEIKSSFTVEGRMVRNNDWKTFILSVARDDLGLRWNVDWYVHSDVLYSATVFTSTVWVHSWAMSLLLSW